MFQQPNDGCGVKSSYTEFWNQTDWGLIGKNRTFKENIVKSNLFDKG